MHAMWLMIGVLCVLAIGYRFYSKFIAAKILTLNDERVTPAYRLEDGHNYHPTSKWVLFGHHFAAISGAGPLIGPVLAAQFGYAPGLLWILIGVVLGGAVQDFVVLGMSIRRNGKSLAQIAYQEVGTISGGAATLGILFVLVIALAGLGKVVVKALGGDTIVYPAGTRFVASPNDHVGFVVSDRSDTSVTYSVPAKTVINYPTDGAWQELGETIRIQASWRDRSDANGPVDLAPSNVQRGRQLVVGPNTRVAQQLPGSSWGTFTIALTIPIALFVGLYMYKIRKGRVFEASIVGGLLTLGAVYLGSYLADPGSVLFAYHDVFNLTEWQITAAMAVYGFVASVLPVWLLLCPRDYLSSFLKLGTVALLVLGVIVANPQLHAPALNHAFLHGGPVIKGSIFPFVFIVIMCGAISGFHALVSSGTTPKMIKKESDARLIGYGAMLMEGLVGIVALIAAAALPNAQYYKMNTPWESMPRYEQQIKEIAKQYDPKNAPDLHTVEQQVGETLAGRTGGAVTLAVGMAKVFDDAAKNAMGATSTAVARIEKLIPYWYHFAIMFEALFILTTIDTGTRVGRFLLQETFGKVSPRWGRPGYWPSAIISTALIVAGWFYFINANSMTAIWPMFGIANQLLAVMALVIATVVIVKEGKGRFAWVTLVPAAFVTTTTMTTAYIMVSKQLGGVLGGTTVGEAAVNAWVSTLLILGIVLCTVVIMAGAVSAVLTPRRMGPPGLELAEPVSAGV